MYVHQDDALGTLEKICTYKIAVQSAFHAPLTSLTYIITVQCLGTAKSLDNPKTGHFDSGDRLIPRLDSR